MKRGEYKREEEWYEEEGLIRRRKNITPREVEKRRRNDGKTKALEG